MALAKKRKAPAKVRPAKSFVIDVHTHIHVPAVSELLDKVKPSAKDRTFFGTDNRATGGSGPLLAGTDPKRRLRHMDKTGVDMQVVSVNGSPPFYWADAALGAKISRAANEGVAGYVAAKPDRFVGLGMVPLQSPARAIKELEYAMGPLGLKGVIGLSNVRGAVLGKGGRARRCGSYSSAGVHPSGPHEEVPNLQYRWPTLGRNSGDAVAHP